MLFGEMEMKKLEKSQVGGCVRAGPSTPASDRLLASPFKQWSGL